MPEVAEGTTGTVRHNARMGEQWRQMLIPIPMDRVMQSDMHRMCMELPEVGMEAAQIVTETVIEHDSGCSYLFSRHPEETR